MAVWEHVKAEVTTPHISYAVTGFALILFGTISLFLKEKLYIGEATVATIYGLIVGPHCLNWFAPTEWGNSDYITLEISRIVLIIQIFAVAVELPKKYMMRHWFSMSMLLLPVMIFGWMISSVFIWKLVPTLRWIDALAIAGCVTATDPVLASAVVGKGKFARRVPGHLRNLLSAESGCNDGMAYPFVIMAIYIEQHEHHASTIAKDFIVVGILYSCVLGIIVGAIIGYGARHLIKFSERMNIIDRESFLVYYFCVALFCAGVGTLCGVDDLLVAFSAGSAFSWDGWFSKQTEESHVSDVIDVLINTAFFVYFGAIIPWPEFNNFDIGIKAWKLVCLAIIILIVRRIPIMLAIKKITPDIHTWREALFCGHFGPIGVGAIFMSLLARAQMETHSETPLKDLVPREDPHFYLVATLWPITCFLVIASIIVHGSSVAVFTLGQRINNMAITLTYTTGGNEPSWMSRLPRRSSEGGNILQLQRMETEEPFSFTKKKRRRSRRSSMLRRRRSSFGEKNRTKSEDHIKIPDHQQDQPSKQDGYHTASHEGSKHDKDPDFTLALSLDLTDGDHIERKENVPARKLEGKELSNINTFREGDHVVVEDNNGTIIHMFDIGDSTGDIKGKANLEIIAPRELGPEVEKEKEEHRANDRECSRDEDKEQLERQQTIEKEDSASRTGTDTSYENEKDQSESMDIYKNGQRTASTQRPRRRSIPRMTRTRSTLEIPRSGHRAHAYMIDDMVYVENDDGDILRRYKYVPRGSAPSGPKKHVGAMRSIWNWLPRFVKNDETPKNGDDQHFEDVEHAPEPMLVPEDEGLPLSSAATGLSVHDEKMVRRRLSQLLQTGQIDRRPSRRESDVGLPLGSRAASTINSQAVVSDGEDEDEEDRSEYENDDDAEPETAVERHRRLAALGIIPTEMDDEDDNDNDIGDTIEGNNSSGNNGESEPKITFMLPERRPE